jgi:hypothetical protein
MAAGDWVSIGNLSVQIEGDWSDLQSAIDQAASASQAGAQEISDAFNTAATAATPQVEHLGEATQTAGAEAEHAGESFHGLSEKLIEMAEFAGIATSVYELAEALKEFTIEAINTSANIEFISTALTDMTGSAAVTREMLEQIEGIASRSIFSFPELAKTAQNMTYLGIEAEKIPPILSDLANLAEHAGTSVDQMASAFDRAWLTGQVGPRIFKALGVGAQEFAEVMGVATGQVVADFKALGPESEDALEILRLVVAKKSLEMGTGLQDTFKVHLNAAAVEWEGFTKTVGDLLKPLADAILTFATKALGELLREMTAFGVMAKAVAQGMAGDWAGAAETMSKGAEKMAETQAAVNAATKQASLSIEDQKKALDDQIAALQKKLTVDIAAAEAEKAKQQLTVSSIAQLKELGSLGAEDPFKTLDTSAQKAFDTFQRGFEGLDEQWNEAAAGIKVDKLYDEFIKLQAEMVQAGAQGSLGFIQVSDALKILNDYVLQWGVGLEKVTADIDKSTDKITGDFDKIADKINDVHGKIGAIPGVIDGVTEAMQKLEAQTAKNRENYDNLRDAVIQLANWGELAGDDLDEAMKKVIEAGKNAGVSVSQLTATILEMRAAGTLTDEEMQALLQAIADNADKASQHIDNIKTHGLDMAQQIGRAIENDLSKALGDIIFQTGNISDAFKKLGRDVVDVILNHIIKDALDPLMNSLDQVLGKVFQLTPTSGGASGVAGSTGGMATTGGTGGGAMSGAMSGAMGWVGIGLGAVSAVSGVISNFQMAHQTDILRSIELNTRETAMFIGGLGSGGVQDWLQIIATNTTPLLDINTWIHDATVQTLDHLSSIDTTLKKQPINVTINIQGATNPQGVAEAVAAYLKTISPAFSP